MTNFDPDDPKWTAYVLGELDDSERALVEAELKVSAEARMLVEELRFAAELTRTELHNGVTIAPLTAQQRGKILASANRLGFLSWLKARPAV
jgi:anti-sigma factor RsiW